MHCQAMSCGAASRAVTMRTSLKQPASAFPRPTANPRAGLGNKAYFSTSQQIAAPISSLRNSTARGRPTKTIMRASNSDREAERIAEQDAPKVATEFITQALFNYFSCSAVAIATVTGGSNAALVTFLMIAAHMVLVPLIAYVGAPASGAHFNPIVTFSFMATGIMKVRTGIEYIVAQCLGGVVGAYAAFHLLPAEMQVKELAGLHTVPGNHTVTQAFFGEVIASFLFIWVIMGLVKSKKGWGQFGPFAIALGITFNMWITGPISSNCINPARAFGPAVVTGFWEHHWVWWTAPFLGAALAAKLYAKYVMPKDQLRELRAEVEQAA